MYLSLLSGRSCTSGCGTISEPDLVCSGFQLSIWKSLPGSVSQTGGVCDPLGSWNGATDARCHDGYDQREQKHPGVYSGSGRLGKYVEAPGFARHLCCFCIHTYELWPFFVRWKLSMRTGLLTLLTMLGLSYNGKEGADSRPAYGPGSQGHAIWNTDADCKANHFPRYSHFIKVYWLCISLDSLCTLENV